MVTGKINRLLLLSGERVVRWKGPPTTSGKVWETQDVPHTRPAMRLPSINLPVQPAASALNSAAALVLAATLIATPFPAFAGDDRRVVGEIPGSGLVFKDTLKIEAFSDPKVDGVQLYLSDFQRPVTEKLAKGDVVRSKAPLTTPPRQTLMVCCVRRVTVQRPQPGWTDLQRQWQCGRFDRCLHIQGRRGGLQREPVARVQEPQSAPRDRRAWPERRVRRLQPAPGQERGFQQLPLQVEPMRCELPLRTSRCRCREHQRPRCAVAGSRGQV